MRLIRSRSNLWLLAFAMFGSTYASTSAQQGNSQSAKEDVKTEQARLDARALIKDIGDPDWRKRETATWKLMNYGPDIYDALRTEYTATKSYEVRKRIKQIVQEIYISEQLGPAPAFLGIQHLPATLFPGGLVTLDARVSPGECGLLISDVIPMTSADQAGLQSGDLWLELDGRRTTPTQYEEFTKWIGGQSPGAKCVLGVFRGGKGRLLDKRMKGFDPRGFAKVKVTLVRHDDDGRIGEGRCALRISNADKADSRLDLKDGDVIIALDNIALTDETTAVKKFETWRKGDAAVPEATKKERAAQEEIEEDKSGTTAKTTPSVQMIRGGSFIKLNVILGRRPSSVEKRQQWVRRRSTAESLDAVEAAFDTWWEDKFVPKQSYPEQLETESFWRMEP